MSSSTAKNSLKMLNVKFMNISETDRCILVFPEAFEYLTEVSKGSRIVIPLLSIIKPSTFAVISIVLPFKTSLIEDKVPRMLSFYQFICIFTSIYKVTFHTSIQKETVAIEKGR